MCNKIAPDSIFTSINRVISRSDCSPQQFYWGLALRATERVLETLPMVIFFFWFSAIQNTQNHTLLAYGETIFQSNFSLFLCFFLLVIFICQLLITNLGQRQSFTGSYRIMASYRQRLIDRVRHLPLGYIYQYRTGQIADILTDDIKKIEAIFTHVAADLFAAITLPIIVFLALLWLDWRLTLSLVSGLPLGLLILASARGFLSHLGRKKQEKFHHTSGLLIEYITGIKTMRLFNKTELWLVKLQQQFNELKQLSLGLEVWGAGPVVAYRFLLEMGLVILLLVCSTLINMEMHWLLFFLLAHKLFIPLFEVAEYITLLRLAVQSEVKVESLFSANLLVEPKQSSTPKNFNICFNNVSFRYDSKPILENISFTACQGSITAIVGPSGAGKTTLMNLISRFYDPASGQITLGGCDLRNIGTDTLYKNISTVFQHVQLYDDTVMQNIKTGKTNATDKEVVEVCKLVNCHQFIMALPNGYETRIGEGGAILSGGERQRLSIARAILKDAPVLLLDEVTAAVDPDNQFEIQQALTCLAKGRTVLMIAHRLSTIRDADQIIVLDEGKLVQTGSHSFLLSHDNLYRQLWRAQEADNIIP